VTELPKNRTANEYEELSARGIGQILDCTPRQSKLEFTGREQLRDKIGWMFETP